MQNIYITEWIKVVYDATVASSLSREQWDTAKKFKKVKEKKQNKNTTTRKSIWALSRRARDGVLQPRYIPWQTEIVFSVHDPKFNWIYFPHCEKKKRTSRDNKT